jgi:hypothetical protein
MDAAVAVDDDAAHDIRPRATDESLALAWPTRLKS